MDIGLFPMVSTAIAAIQHAIADVEIKGWLLDSPNAKTAYKESPAPATSTGYTDKAGKDWVFIFSTELS